MKPLADNAPRRSMRGVTLIELMVVIGVVGLLSTIAYASYAEQVLKGKRADARSILHEVMAAEERYFTERNTYTVTATDMGFPGGTLKSSHKTHTVAMAVGPTGDLKTSVQVTATSITGDTACATMSLTSTNVQSGTGTDPSLCW